MRSVAVPLAASSRATRSSAPAAATGLSRVGQHRRADVRERDVMPASADEPGADLGLQALQLLADRRLGHVQARGRTAEVQLLGEDDERPQQARVDAGARRRNAISHGRSPPQCAPAPRPSRRVAGAGAVRGAQFKAAAWRADGPGMTRALRQVCSYLARRRASLPLRAALVMLLALAPVGLALTPGRPVPAAAAPVLGDIARAAGCVLSEFDSDPHSKPSGQRPHRRARRDRRWLLRRTDIPPSALASMRALLHGRVLVQYQPKLPAVQLAGLEQLVRDDPDQVLLFANTTGMPQPVAATAYLTLMTCPRVDARTLAALRAFGSGAARSRNASERSRSIRPSARRPLRSRRARSAAPAVRAAQRCRPRCAGRPGRTTRRRARPC